MKLPSMLKNKAKRGSNGISSSWKWKPLKNLKTMLKTNPSFTTFVLDSSWSQSKCSFTSTAAKEGRDKAMIVSSSDTLLENAANAMRIKRLFFEPGRSSSILGSARFVFQDCLVQAVETLDPYVEFRVSMEEMVTAFGLVKNDICWEYLEGLLAWYLRMNDKKNHGLIVEAFIDMFTALPSCSMSSI